MLNSSMVEGIDIILASMIPKENFTEEDFKRVISNYYKISISIEPRQLRNTRYIIYKSISYFSKRESVLTASSLFRHLNMEIDNLMRDPNVDVNEIFAGTQHYDLDNAGSYEVAKRELYKIVAQYYHELTQIEVTEAMMNTELLLYKREKRKENFIQTLQEAMMIATQGLNVIENGRRSFLSDVNEAYPYLMQKLQENETRYNSDIEEEFDTSKGPEALRKLRERAMQNFVPVTDTGIEPIDRVIKNLFSTQLIGIESGSGVGKTRFAVHLCWRAIVFQKKNVYFATMEQEDSEIWNMFVSLHLYWKHNISVPDADLKTRTYDPVLEPYIRDAENDLLLNENYGRLRIRAKQEFVETMFDEFIGVYLSEFKFDIICIDYASLVESVAQQKYGMQLHQIVTAVYKNTKSRLCRGLKVMAIVINQLTREGVAKLAKGELTDTTDGANSGETYKSADLNFVLSQGPELEAKGKMRISTPKVRSGAKISNVIIDVNIGCSHFSYNGNGEDNLTDEEYQKLIEEELEKVS